MPENTLPAFMKAVELGVTTLELDLVVSADKELVVSHEPWMSHVICSHPNGKAVTKAEQKDLNIFEMPYKVVQTFDCGMRFHPDFPNQVKMNAVKPTLNMVVRSVRRFAADQHYREPAYNIEIKSDEKYYGVFVPKPDVFVDLVVNEIRRMGIENQTTIQSFDVNVLEELYKIADRKFKIAFLTGKGKKFAKNLGKLNFKPDIYSPNYKLLNEKAISELHEQKIKVIPWTINNKDEMEELIRWGVDGIITDYPDLLAGKIVTVNIE
jgi:glycerophosphoryl diester phosphodiesterase